MARAKPRPRTGIPPLIRKNTMLLASSQAFTGAGGQMVFDASPDESLADLRAMSAWVDGERTGEGPYDIVVERSLAAFDDAEARAEAARWEEAGATWWLDDAWWEMYGAPDDPEPLRRRIRRGPPR